MKNRVLKFEWDNGKGEEWNGNHLMIMKHLPQRENPELTHIEGYGISMDIPDDTKDFRLKRFSCHVDNVRGAVNEISKSEARELLIQEVDKALDILFDEREMKDVEEYLNVPEPEMDEEE